MVVQASTFDNDDFALPPADAWYIRRPGWIRGPYTLEDMLRFRRLGWLGRSESVSRDMVTWRAAGDVHEIWDDAPTGKPQVQPPPPGGGGRERWQYVISGKPSDEQVSFATLQLLAGVGRLAGDDLVWREGWPEWRRAGDVPGLLAGPAEWCTVCGEEVSPRAYRCSSCGTRLPGLLPPHAELCMATGILGVVLFPVFPLWMIAMFIGHHDRAEIAKGRMDPRGKNAATFGLRLGIIGGVMFAAAGLVALVILVASRFS
jgi:hypothetical protein